MKKCFRVMAVLLLLFRFNCDATAFETGERFLEDSKSKKEFALEVSSLIGSAWKKWQDAARVGEIDVDGSQGILSPGDIGEPVFRSSDILDELDHQGKSTEYIRCIRAVALAVANGMRLWQRGYVNGDIPFPQGATCVYTLTPCYNVPVTIASGSSTGDDAMTEEKLYNYMLYRGPGKGIGVRVVFHASAAAISQCFQEWKESCLISDILAKGGVAPPPAPMGAGPGLVKGAKGNGGKLTGAYFNSNLMYKKMCENFKDSDP